MRDAPALAILPALADKGAADGDTDCGTDHAIPCTCGSGECEALCVINGMVGWIERHENDPRPPVSLMDAARLLVDKGTA